MASMTRRKKNKKQKRKHRAKIQINLPFFVCDDWLTYNYCLKLFVPMLV